MSSRKLISLAIFTLMAGAWLFTAGRADSSSARLAEPALLPAAFQISSAGSPGDARYYALDPAVGYSLRTHRYLVVWAEDGSLDDEFEIFGQLLDAASGSPLGPALRVSQVGLAGDPAFDAYDPSLACSTQSNECLVVYRADTPVDDELEIYAQRVDTSRGIALGSSVRLSYMGPDGDPAFDAFNPAVAYNEQTNEYLVVWHGDHQVDNLSAVYGRRVRPDGSLPAGSFQISTIGRAQDVALAYNPMTAEYLAAWEGETTAPGEMEILVRRLGGTGGLISAAPIQISTMGPDGDSRYAAGDPSVAVNPFTGEYLVVWSGENGGLLADNELEVYGQRLGGDASQIGSDDFRLSSLGPDGDPAYKAFGAEAVFMPGSGANEWLVVWRGDDPRNFGDGPLADDEFEIFGQWLSDSGSPVGENEFRISHMGPDGSSAFAADRPAVAVPRFGTSLMVTWQGNQSSDVEIFGSKIVNQRASNWIFVPLIESRLNTQ